MRKNRVGKLVGISVAVTVLLATSCICCAASAFVEPGESTEPTSPVAEVPVIGNDTVSIEHVHEGFSPRRYAVWLYALPNTRGRTIASIDAVLRASFRCHVTRHPNDTEVVDVAPGDPGEYQHRA